MGSRPDEARATALAHDVRAGLRPPTRPAWSDSPDLFRTIWTRPRATVRWALDHGTGRLAIPIVAAAAVAEVVADPDLLAGIEYFGRLGWPPALALGVVAGCVLWGLLALSLLAAGRALGGVATLAETTTALAWALVPAAAALPFALLVALGRAGSLPLVAFPGVIVAKGLGLWSLVTTVKAVAEAHRFSAMRAWGTLLLVLAVWIVLAAVLGLVAPSVLES